MKATRGNMKKMKDSGKDIIAYSFWTEEESSADPNDYFTLRDDECLKDSQANEMDIVEVVTTISYLDIEDGDD